MLPPSGRPPAAALEFSTSLSSERELSVRSAPARLACRARSSSSASASLSCSSLLGAASFFGRFVDTGSLPPWLTVLRCLDVRIRSELPRSSDLPSRCRSASPPFQSTRPLASQAGDGDCEPLLRTSQSHRRSRIVVAGELEPGDGGVAAVPSGDLPGGIGLGRPRRLPADHESPERRGGHPHRAAALRRSGRCGPDGCSRLGLADARMRIEDPSGDPLPCGLVRGSSSGGPGCAALCGDGSRREAGAARPERLASPRFARGDQRDSERNLGGAKRSDRGRGFVAAGARARRPHSDGRRGRRAGKRRGARRRARRCAPRSAPNRSESGCGGGAAPRRRRRSGASDAALRSASASACWSSAGTSQPVPGATISAGPCASAASTGSPQAIASTRTSPNASATEGSTSRSAALSASGSC